MNLFGQPLLFARPGALWLLCGLTLVPLLRRRSLVDFSSAQQWVSTGIRMIFLAVLILSLSRPSRVTEKQAVATVLCVDVSDSMSDDQLEAARKFVEGARQAQTSASDSTLRVILFAKTPSALDLPPVGTALAPFKRSGSTETDIASALRLAYGLYPAGTIKRAVLISDGNETSSDLAAEAERAREHGVHIDHLSLSSVKRDEVLVRSIKVPSQVKLGAPFEVEAELFSSRPQAVTVTLYRDDFVNPFSGKRSIDLLAGQNSIRWKSEVVEGGVTRYRAALSGPLLDHFPSNNEAFASVAVEGRPRILYVEGESSASSYLAGALRHENMDVDVRSPASMPSSLSELSRYDLILVSDVQASALSGREAAIESYVRDLGGGFIMAGGENSFGSGGYSGTRMEKLLPVRFDGERKRDQPALALELLIDRSGSMSGRKLELAKDAAKATAELLGSADLIGVIAFDAEARSIVRLQRAANRARISGDIARLQAGGGTNILPALRAAYEELEPAQAKVKHVILLTDGEASYDGISQVVDEMVRQKITVSAVGVGSGADKTLLTMIADRGQGRFYFTQDEQNIPRIFTKETKEVARSSVVEEAIRIQVVKHAELLDGVPLASAPRLRGYISTKAKPLSEVILASNLGEPILARWRVGLGQAVAFTSDVKNRWASEWLRWPGYGIFFSHLVRATMRHSASATGSSTDLKVSVDPPRVHFTFDAVSADDRFITGLDSTVRLFDTTRGVPGRGEGSPIASVALSETAAGHYEGEFRLDGIESAARTFVAKVGEASAAFSIPYAQEYLALPPNDALLEHVSRETGGRTLTELPTAAQLFDSAGEQVKFERALWPLLLWMAIGLLLVDVGLRRIRLF